MAEDPKEPIELYRARWADEAHALRAELVEAGVPALVDSELLQGIAGEVPGGWITAPRVLVPRGHLAKANSILAEFIARALDVDTPTGTTGDDSGLRCLACRAPMGEADVCPACGWSYESTVDDPDRSDD
jgi:Putative prokaryotic signal transducing protein